jgi:uncharacterized protein
LSRRAVSPPNVETMERMWAAWHGDDMSKWLEFFAVDAVWHTREDEPDAGSYRGHEGINRLMEFWTDNFDDLRVEPEEFVDAGDQVVVTSVLHGKGRASGATVELPYTFICALNDGKIVEIREYVSKDEAMKALDVGESAERD